MTEIKEPSTPATSPFTRRKSRTIASLLSAGVMIVFPLLLLMANVRLVMSPLFLRFEYSRPGFPDDFYGFTKEDRLNYAPYAVNYLLNGEDITFLGDLTFPDGTSLFNIRELRHMRDVKSVTQVVYLVTVVVAVLWVGAVYLLRKFGRLRVTLFRASILTLGLIATIVIAAVINWNFFFTGFHTLFFEGGTWYFAYSDTLIRLFPEQFWFDAALTIGGFTTFEAVIVILITRFGSFHPSRNSNVDAAHA